MKNYLVSMTMFFALASTAIAQETHASTPKTREQVKAELAQAMADGSYAKAQLDYVPIPAISTRSRAEVKAELEQALKDGSYQRSNLDYTYPVTNFVSTKSRAEVLAELKQAMDDGTLQKLQRECYPQ